MSEVFEPADKAQNIDDAKRIAKAHDSQAVIIIRVDKNGSANVTMYADTDAKRAGLTPWIRGLVGNLPANPFTTLMGWNNTGVPTDV